MKCLGYYDYHIHSTVSFDALSGLYDACRVAAQKGITISLSDEAREYIAKAGFDPIYGARPLKRALYEEVEDKLAELILEDRLKDGSSVQFVLERDGDSREFIQAVYS